MTDANIGKDVCSSGFHRLGVAEIFKSFFKCLSGVPARRGTRGPCHRWTPVGAGSLFVGMILDQGTCITARFEDVRRCLGESIAASESIGVSFNGLLNALSRFGNDAVDAVRSELRRRITAAQRPRRGDLVLAVDSSKFILPATRSNEDCFGIADNGTIPQSLLTAIVDLGTGTPWDWRVVKARGCERANLLEMIPQLPRQAILLADRLFVGHSTWHALNAQGVGFVIRVGANVSLIKDLLPESDLEIDERKGTVYSWPKAHRKTSPPLRLRLVTVKASGTRIYLITNILNRDRLSDKAVAELYRRRWGVEIIFRTLKQSLGFDRLMSRSGTRAAVEANWMMIALGILAALASRVTRTNKRSRSRFSPAKGILALRRAVLGIAHHSAKAVLDAIDNAVERIRERSSSKVARNQRKTRNSPKRDTGKPPKVSPATAEMKRLAAEWKPPPRE